MNQFWHQHIINTRKYGPDCEQAVGHFLHHSEGTISAALMDRWPDA